MQRKTGHDGDGQNFKRSDVKMKIRGLLMSAGFYLLRTVV